jgi:hypothetical protein
VLLLSIAWQTFVWIVLVPRWLPLGAVAATVSFAVAFLGPPVVASYALMQSLYVRPLDAKARIIAARER